MDPDSNAVLLILTAVMLIITGLRLSGFRAVLKRMRKLTRKASDQSYCVDGTFRILRASVAQLDTSARHPLFAVYSYRFGCVPRRAVKNRKNPTHLSGEGFVVEWNSR
jgi:hypothetical protein